MGTIPGTAAIYEYTVRGVPGVGVGVPPWWTWAPSMGGSEHGGVGVGVAAECVAG